MIKNKENPNELVVCADRKSRPRWASRSGLCWTYFDHEWGRPPVDLKSLFEVLTLVVFQVGLTWHAVLAKREGLKKAFSDFDVHAVATFTEADVQRLLQDPQIFRNRRKIEATMKNAQVLVSLGDSQEHFISLVEEDITVKELKQLGFSHIGPTSLSIIRQATGLCAQKPA
ncbi:DNA-3-methyladenine glycosylase I [Corynebacterium crudilactis]|uniref:DNA-3-methyladenine glycosylase I n=1 Tax=Corynebacterium crudilactis TaxID=1652495 RepID=UPI00093F4235|nr:DNA-3-methyladenine glycosylase I [Corynebacterium crudilactis]